MLRPAYVALVAALTFGGSALPIVARADVVPASTDSDQIVVVVHNLRNNRGSVRCSLYNGPTAFPENLREIIARARAVPSGGAARCVFDRPMRGHEYAVVVHHDENDDNVFQRGVFGVPLEGYGFSNDVHPMLSAPSFAECQFRFAGGTSILRVAAQY